MTRTRSRHAYAQIQDALPRSEALIYDAIRHLGNPTRQDVAKYLGVSDGWVSARVRSMLNSGVVIESGEDTYTAPSGKAFHRARLAVVHVAEKIEITTDDTGQRSFIPA